jgi:hypothetical protein
MAHFPQMLRAPASPRTANGTKNEAVCPKGGLKVTSITTPRQRGVTRTICSVGASLLMQINCPKVSVRVAWRRQKKAAPCRF